MEIRQSGLFGSSRLLPIYAILTTADLVFVPAHASLAFAALSAAFLWIYTTLKLRGSSHLELQPERWSRQAGFALVLVHVGRRAAVQHGTLGWALSLVPWIIIAAHGFSAVDSASMVHRDPPTFLLLAVTTWSTAYGMGWSFASLTSIVIAVAIAFSQCSALWFACVRLQQSTLNSLPKSMGLLYSTSERALETQRFQALRNSSAVIAIGCALMSYSFELPWICSMDSYEMSQLLACSILAGAPGLYCFFKVVDQHGDIDTSLWTVVAVLMAKAIQQPRWSVIFAAAIGIYAVSFTLPRTSLINPSKLDAGGWFTIAMVFLFLTIQTFLLVVSQGAGPVFDPKTSLPAFDTLNGAMQLPSNIHPIKYLVSQAEERFDDLITRQSQSLAETSVRYRQRYGIPPPPHFDQWYEFSRRNDVQIFDDYDTIHDAMQPFWALRPTNIRSRVQETIGFEGNYMIALMIRNGRIARLEGGQPWQREAIRGMLSSFVEFLPDLDAAFNAHDEPRVVVPHDELSAMVATARSGPMRAALSNDSVINTFSPRPSDMTDGTTVREYRASRFNEYAHQNVWVPARLSCSPESPARAFNEEKPDATSSYELGALGFIYNQTAATDLCNIPSLRGTHAFLDRPNAFHVAHDLVPIFSESKVSSFQDVPFPSMWHWYGKLFVNRTEDMHLYNTPMYDSALDMPWERKDNSLFWRGSTTGGWSQDGGWRRHHRQRMITQLNSPGGSATILHDTAPNTSATQDWRPQQVRRSSFAHLVNVSFTGIGQCAEADCAAQREFFAPSERVPAATAWAHKHVLDMDGNAFSARFYAILRSRSLAYKAALFREWHDDFLVPWLHYIPLSLSGRDALEALRFFAEDEEGVRAAKRLAFKQREWAGKALRRVDMEAWMFRCLLEYARVMDDNRGGIGYAG